MRKEFLPEHDGAKSQSEFLFGQRVTSVTPLGGGLDPSAHLVAACFIICACVACLAYLAHHHKGTKGVSPSRAGRCLQDSAVLPGWEDAMPAMYSGFI